MWRYLVLHPNIFNHCVGDRILAQMHSVNYSDNGTYLIEGTVLARGWTTGNVHVQSGPYYMVKVIFSTPDVGVGGIVEIYQSDHGLYGLW